MVYMYMKMGGIVKRRTFARTGSVEVQEEGRGRLETLNAGPHSP
jgi:hypothetical protein